MINRYLKMMVFTIIKSTNNNVAKRHRIHNQKEMKAIKKTVRSESCSSRDCDSDRYAVRDKTGFPVLHCIVLQII